MTGADMRISSASAPTDADSVNPTERYNAIAAELSGSTSRVTEVRPLSRKASWLVSNSNSTRHDSPTSGDTRWTRRAGAQAE